MTYFLFVSCTLNMFYIDKIYNKHIGLSVCICTCIFSGELVVPDMTIKSVSGHGQNVPKGTKSTLVESRCPRQAVRPPRATGGTHVLQTTLRRASAWQDFPVFRE